VESKSCEVHCNLGSYPLKIQIGDPGLECSHQLRDSWLSVSINPAHDYADRRIPVLGYLSAVQADQVGRDLLVSCAGSSTVVPIPLQAGVAATVLAVEPSFFGIHVPEVGAVRNVVSVVVSDGARPAVPVRLVLLLGLWPGIGDGHGVSSCEKWGLGVGVGRTLGRS
jgi:hypothetical protein